MEGKGYYNQHSQQQANAARHAYEYWRKAASEVPLGPLVRVGDFGSSQGLNSLEPMRRAVETLRSRSAEVEIEVTHTDLPQNDFNSLIALVSGPSSYVQRGVYAGARGGSFYGQLFPGSSLTLAWSSIALHWLSRRVEAPVCSNVLSDPRGKEQSRLDWCAWLEARAREMVPGGQVVLVTGLANPDGTTGAEPMMEAALEALPPGLAGEVCLPTYYRKREEWLAPLGGDFELLDSSEVALDDLYWKELQSSGDRRAYAESVVGAWRAAFAGALLGSRDVGDFQAQFTDLIEQAPERGRCAWKLMLLRLRRR